MIFEQCIDTPRRRFNEPSRAGVYRPSPNNNAATFRRHTPTSSS